MQQGIIGMTTEGDINDLEDFTTEDEDGHTQAVRVLDELQSIGFDTVGYRGKAYSETTKTIEEPFLDSTGTITTEEKTQVIPRATEFVLVPTGDRDEAIVVVGSSSGVWLLDVLAEERDVTLERCEIDLAGFHQDHEGASEWLGGASELQGQANSVTAFGGDVFEATGVGEDLQDAAVRGSVNQLGVEYSYQGQILKARMSASGFAQVYGEEPGTETFLKWLGDELLYYLTPAEPQKQAEEGDEEEASEDDAQAGEDQTELETVNEVDG